MPRRFAVAAAAVAISTFAIAGNAALNSIEKGHYKVDGVAKPGLGAFSGEGSDVSAKEEGGKLVFTADLKRLDMGLRQSHTHEAFKIDKHSTAKLVVDKSALKMPEDNAKVRGEVTGALTLSGTTKPVKVHYVASRTGSDYHVKEAKFTFNYMDFGIEKICKLGVCVDPKVTITVEGVKLRDK